MLPKRRCLLIAFGALLHSSAHGLSVMPGTLRQSSSLWSPRSGRHYRVLHSSNSGNEASGESAPLSKAGDSKEKISLQQRFGRYWPTLKTASTAFVAGSLSAVILSIILFNRSLDYNPESSTYQNVDISTSLLPAPSRSKSLSESSQMQQSVTLYRSIIETLKSSYVDEIDTDEMVETSVGSMLKTLDPYTQYLSPKDLAKRKNLVGIGAFVMKSGVSSDSVTLDGKSASKLISGIPSAIKLPNQLLEDKDATQKQAFKVVLSLEGYAYDAGLRVGDELISIDGQSITGDDASTMPSLEEVRELLLGIPGTTVELQYIRPGVEGVQTIQVKRAIVKFPSVPCATLLKQTKDGSIGYIRLRRFGDDAGESMKAAIQSLQSKSSQEEAALSGLVLDLRDNSGGELFEAIKVASLFVPDNTYLGSSKGEGSMMPNQSYYSGKSEDLIQSEYPSQSNSISSELNQQLIDPDKTRIVVLTNKQTASASEFLAGVFQDLDLGVIVGDDKETLGKGVGQRELPLPSGALKLTYHEFYTPSGRCVQRQYDQTKSKQSTRRQTKSDELFYTTNGRTLADRRGVQVDRRFKPPRSDLNELLTSSGAYYKYASQWFAKHPAAKIADVDDTLYKDFQSFVLKEQQSGNLKLEEIFDEKHTLQQMETILKSSNDKDLSLQSLARIREEIVKDLLTDFDLSKDVIKRELELNLLTRDMRKCNHPVHTRQS